MAEAIEQWSALAKHQRHGTSRLVMAAGLTALNVGQLDMKLISAKQHYSALNLDRKQRGVVPGGIRPKLNELHARCKCHREGTKKKAGLGNGDGDARNEV